MTEFIAWRPKLYSYRKLDSTEDKKCKGIKKCIIKKTLLFNDYKNCLTSSRGPEGPASRNVYTLQLMFRSSKHEVTMIEVNKVALSRRYDKRISKQDGISMLACGHKSLGWNVVRGWMSFV